MFTFHQDNIDSIRTDVPIPTEEGIYILIIEYGQHSTILTVNVFFDHICYRSKGTLGYTDGLKGSTYLLKSHDSRVSETLDMLWIPRLIAPLDSIEHEEPRVVSSLLSKFDRLDDLERENAMLRELLDRPDALGSKLAYDEVVRVLS